MKVLFLTNLCEHLNGFYNIESVEAFDCSGRGLDYPLSLLKELGKYAQVDVYSPPLKGFMQTKPVVNPPDFIKFTPTQVAVPIDINAEMLNGRDYDIVLLYAESMFAYIRNWNRLRLKKVAWFLSSPQQILLPEYRDAEFDAILTVADVKGVTDFGKEMLRRGAKWFPLSVDTNRFRRVGIPKTTDVCLLGNLNPTVYPIRVKALEYLSKKQYSVMLRPRYGEDYVYGINASRVFLTCSGTLKFPVMKYFEAMACGTLLLADDPLDAEELGFKPDVNYLSLGNEFSQTRLQEALDWAFTHVGDAEVVSHAGERLMKQRHSNMVRAKELYEMLALGD